MPRRSQTSELDTVLVELQKMLKQAQTVLEGNAGVREKVKSLIPVHFSARDLGASLVSPEIANNGRARILYYFKSHVGQILHGHELMVISGIGEYGRRARELRVEYGWPVITGNTIKDIRNDKESEFDLQELPPLKRDEYMLLSLNQDVEAAGRWETAKNIRNQPGSVSDKVLNYLQANVGKAVSGEELKYVAKDKTEWARRVRELRTDHGWSVVTKATGRPDLPVGTYLLEDLNQAPPHDRNIKDAVRRSVLRRDNYHCVDCGWNRDLWNRDDPRHLEVHHIIMHAKGGSNEAENLVTLCNICHDVRHQTEKVR